ncbi:MAG: propanediol utilization protein [Firmicutes bacterium]|nr:propanediol utilization protein [Bacillota bacterium]
MEYSINARISNRHVHLTKEMYDLLFDGEMTKKNDLSQIGEFSSNQVVTIKNGDKEIKNVRVLGPLRNYTQIEVSKKDARTLGINPPVRRSGDLENSEKVTLVTEKNEVETNGVIISQRHIHMNKEDASKFGVEDRQLVQIKVNGDKSGIMDAEVKISENGVFELHIDTDDACAFLLEDYDKVTMIV